MISKRKEREKKLTRNHNEEEGTKVDIEIPKEGILDDQIEKCLLENNLLVIHGEMNEEGCNKVSRKLLFLQCKKAKNVKIVLNSVGGEVYHALLVYNTIEDLKKSGTKVSIEARGLCASMGVIILMAGTTRIASKYTRFLLHEVSSMTYGKASEVKEESRELTKLNLMLDEIIANRSKVSLKDLQKKTRKKDLWLSAEEALNWGLIDKVV